MLLSLFEVSKASAGSEPHALPIQYTSASVSTALKILRRY